MFEPQRRTLEALGGWADLGEPRDTANRTLGGSCTRSRVDTNLIRRGLGKWGPIKTNRTFDPSQPQPGGVRSG